MLAISRSSCSAAVKATSSSSSCGVVAPRAACRTSASVQQPQQHEQLSVVVRMPASSAWSCSRRQVRAHFFRFGKNGFGAEDAGIVGSQGRDDYNYDDVEQYFNYMGFLATEGTYDRMEAMLKANIHPIDIILLLACSENDTPKVGEILKAGADVRVKGLDGKRPMDLAVKPELIAMLKEYETKATASV